MRIFITAAVFAAITTLSAVAQAQLAEEVGAIPNGTSPQGGAPPVCSDPLMIADDDGGAENGYGGNAAVVAEATFVQQFDAADFPQGAIDTVCTGWVSLGAPSVDFDIVVFDDDGPGGVPGTELGAVPASAGGLPTGLPETLFAYNILSSGISLPATGNFYLGVRFAPSDPNVFIAADETGATNVGAGQVFFDTGDPGTDDWQAVNSLFPNYSAMLIRALPGTTPPPPAQPVSTLSNWGLILLSLLLAAIAVVVIRLR